jgi:hypothetical protein
VNFPPEFPAVSARATAPDAVERVRLPLVLPYGGGVRTRTVEGWALAPGDALALLLDLPGVGVGVGVHASPAAWASVARRALQPLGEGRLYPALTSDTYTTRRFGPPGARGKRDLDELAAEFSEEAEALTAKAQQLMAQHSTDAALLDAGRRTRQVPGGLRVAVDAPYEESKVHLLQAVADANRCRTVWSRNLGFSTVVGFASDARAVELLYTSLLVQAQSALQAAGTRTYSDGASRTRSYRQSFLTAYANRIAQRLSQAAERVTEAAGEDHGPALLPVLTSRAQAVDNQMDEWFAEVSYSRRQAHPRDLEGWAHGTAAANRAQLHGKAGALR